MEQKRAEKRRLDKAAKKAKDGEQPEDPNADIDAWLLPDDVVPGQPLPLHRLQLALSEYQRGNNTRWMSGRHLKLGNDIDDETMKSEARANARRARAIMDQAVEDVREAWPELTGGQRDDLYDALPAEVLAAVIGDTSEDNHDSQGNNEGPD